jgi:Domain of unknown function (DUF4349)
MRIIPFPDDGHTVSEQAWQAEVEAALSGEAEGAVADSWRELRGDVRALAPPMSSEFEQRLKAELEERMARRRARAIAVPSRLRSRGGSRGAVALGMALALVAALVIAAAPWRSGTRPLAPGASAARPAVRSAVGGGVTSPANAPSAKAANSPIAPQGPLAAGATQSPGGASSAPGRVQQLAASVTLGTTPDNVQAASDGVARVAQRDEGFVQSSHVQVQQQGASEATLTLRLPSSRLGAALASIGRLAPVRAQSQSLQDITDTYNAARQRLTDAIAERQALIRALAGATTEAQIASLRERLSQARGAVDRDRSALQAVSQRASTAEVEVTVLGDARSQTSGGLTLDGGLHDAGRVLVSALVVLLIGAAVLVPLALALVALVAGGRAWRRYQRERVLDTP